MPELAQVNPTEFGVVTMTVAVRAWVYEARS